MSALYGTCVGMRGMATRLGSRASGIKVSAQSYQGSLITRMDLNENDKPIVRLDITDDSDSSGWGSNEVFEGSLEELKQLLLSYKKKQAKKLAKAAE